jgi:hypothetical protein
VRSKLECGLEDWAMEKQDRFGLRIRGIAQVEDVAIVAKAAEDRGARRGGDG